MKIDKVVIHELEKESGKTGARLNLYNETFDATEERVIKLINELNNRYKSKNETYSIFDKASPTAFHTAFEKYYKDQETINFIDFTKNAAEDLKIRINGITAAKGGYLIFCHYEATRKYVSVFLVRNTTGFSFKRNTAKTRLDVDDIQHIDFDNLAMACRISIDSYRKKAIRYLSFINRKSDEMSDYFTQWISAADMETNADDTLQLLELLKLAGVPKAPKGEEQLDKTEFDNMVYNTIKNNPGKMVNINNLSELFYGDSKFLANYIEENEIVINGEFKAHARTLKRLIQIKVKADKVELSFPYELYRNNTIRISGKNNNQIIITSQKLVELIKEDTDLS